MRIHEIFSPLLLCSVLVCSGSCSAVSDVTDAEKQASLAQPLQQAPWKAFLDKSNYTREASARIIYMLNSPKRDFRELFLSYRVVSIKGKEVLSRKRIHLRDQRGSVEMPISGIPAGLYRVQISLQENETTYETELSLKKLLPGPGSEVKIDRANNAVLFNGKPFFPVGFYMVPHKDMKRLAEAGFNCVVGWDQAFLDKSTEEDARNAGLKVIEWPARFFEGQYYGNTKEANTSIRENIENGSLARITRVLRRQSSLLSYYGLDEPHEEQRDLSRSYKGVLEAEDPYHPVFGLFAGAVRMHHEWRSTMDIPGVDLYIAGGADPGLITSSPQLVGQGTEEACRLAEEMNAPCWIVLSAEIWTNSIRPLIREEQRLQTYLAIIHGAKGVIYFVWPVQTAEMWDTLKELAAEMNWLAPSLLLQIPAQKNTVLPDVRDRFGLPVLHLSLRENPAGEEILLVANTSADALDITYTLPHLDTGTKINLLFGRGGNRELMDGRFSDHIEAYGTRAYLFGNGRTISASPREVRAEISGRQFSAVGNAGEKLTAAVQKAKRGVSEWYQKKTTKNLLSNSGFEYATVRGWPDYWRGWSQRGFSDGPDSTWRLDESMFRSGYRSLRVDFDPAQGSMESYRTYSLPQDAISKKKGKNYTFSAFMRSDREGARAVLNLGYIDSKGKRDMTSKEVVLGTKWRRYEVAGNPDWGIGALSVNIGPSSRGKTLLWIDDCQLEEGGSATEYEPGPYVPAYLPSGVRIESSRAAGRR